MPFINLEFYTIYRTHLVDQYHAANVEWNRVRTKEPGLTIQEYQAYRRVLLLSQQLRTDLTKKNQENQKERE